jgi:alkylhydroperoxidase family enzyme
MSRIRLVSREEATGPLAEDYAAAEKRAGRIWNIVKIMSPNPAVLRASMEFYKAVMYGPSPLSRVQREMLAVVVSATTGCRY